MESNGHHPSEEYKRKMLELFRKQERAQLNLMAYMICLHGEIRAVIASSDTVRERAQVVGQGSGSISEEFWKIRKEKIQESLIELEDQNSEVAALVQQILDEPQS